MIGEQIIKALERMSEEDPEGFSANILDFINRLKEENDDLNRIVDLRDKRQYYRKFVDEVFRKQKGKELSDPDYDYIYQLYFEQQAEIEEWKTLAYEGKEKVEFLEIEKSAMQHRIDKQQAEIEKLSTEIDQKTEMMANLGVELDKAQENADLREEDLKIAHEKFVY